MRVGWSMCSKCRGKKKKKKRLREACSESEVYACIYYRTPASLSASFKRPCRAPRSPTTSQKADIRKTQERPISCQIYTVIRATKPSRSLLNAKHAPRPAPTRPLNAQQMPNSLQVKRGCCTVKTCLAGSAWKTKRAVGGRGGTRIVT